VAGSLAVAVLYCLWFFDRDFLMGVSRFWSYPIGTVPGASADLIAALSGYWAFVQDDWTLPLFSVRKLGIPHGTNIIFTDSIPCVALLGRLVFRATGHLVNLYGAWTALCVALLPASLTALCYTLGARSIAAALAATAIGLSVPPFWFRWGHLSLMAQFEIVLALLLYFSTRRKMQSGRFLAAASALTLLSLWTHSYMFLMVSGVIAATVGQRWSDGDIRLRRAVGMLAVLAVVAIGGVALSGHLSGSGSLSAEGFGFYSMDVLSPVIPQMSGLLPSTEDRLFAGAGGQYEGYNYLGAGALLLVAFMALIYARRGEMAAAWRRNAWLIGMLAAYFLLAVSNVVYVGGMKVASVPLPGALMWFLEIVRSSGRFFWPVLYMLIAGAIASCAVRRKPEAVILLLVASTLQWFDAGPLRLAVARSIAAEPSPPLALDAWGPLVAKYKEVIVLPSFACLARDYVWSRAAAVELQLLAARAGVGVNSVYAARYREDCQAERTNIPLAPPEADKLLVYLDGLPNFDRFGARARELGYPCVSSARLLACGSTGVDGSLLRESDGKGP
jgi:hypothetical protein